MLFPLMGLIGILWLLDQRQQRLNAAWRYTLWQLEVAVQDTTMRAREYDKRMEQDMDPDNPENPECIWCDGVPIPWGTEYGRTLLEEVQTRAINEGMYNSKNLEDGGWWDMHVDYYRVQGYSTNRAEELVWEAIELGHIPSLFYCPQPISA